MAKKKDKPLIPDAFGRIMEDMAKETLINELSFALTKEGHFAPGPDEKKRAIEIVERVAGEGKLFEFLEKTMPEPCPTCGHLPGW